MSKLGQLLSGLALEGNIRILATQLLVSQIGLGMFAVVWQPYILSRGFTIMDLGLVQSTINLATALGLFAWGYLSDRYGRKPVILAATACRALSIAALLVSGNPLFLYVFSFLIGFSALWMQSNPARSALVMESVTGSRRATAYATLLMVSQVVSTLMASAGGYLAVAQGYTPIFLVTLVGEAAGIFIMWRGLKETRDPKTQTESVFSIKDLLPERELMPLYTILAVIGVGYGIGYSVFYGALVDSLGFTTVELGLMMTVSNLTWALMSVPGGKLSERIGGRKVILISLVMSITTAVGFILFHSLFGLLVFSVTNALDPCLWIPNWVSYLTERIPAGKRSIVFGKLDAYSRILSIPAPWIGGLIYSSYGFNAPLLVHLVLAVIWGTLLVRELWSPPVTY